MYDLTDHDQVIVDLGFAVPGQLTRVSVHYRANIEGRWRSVARYDNAHGPAHRHLFWARKNPVRPVPAPSLAQLVEIAKQDIKANWPTYRRRMEMQP